MSGWCGSGLIASVGGVSAVCLACCGVGSEVGNVISDLKSILCVRVRAAGVGKEGIGMVAVVALPSSTELSGLSFEWRIWGGWRTIRRPTRWRSQSIHCHEALGGSNASILTTLTRMAKSSVGISLNVDSTQSLGAPEFLKQRAKTAVGPEETPIGDWSVTRIRTAAHGTAHSWCGADPVWDQRLGWTQ